MLALAVKCGYVGTWPRLGCIACAESPNKATRPFDHVKMGGLQQKGGPLQQSQVCKCAIPTPLAGRQHHASSMMMTALFNRASSAPWPVYPPVVDVAPQHIVLGRCTDEVCHSIGPVAEDVEQPLLLPAGLILATCNSHVSQVGQCGMDRAMWPD